MITKFYQEIRKIFDSEYPFYLIIQDVWNSLLAIWNYSIFETADKQKVLIGNIILGIVFFIIGTSIVTRVNAALKKKLSKILPEQSMVNSLERLSYYFFMVIMVIFVLDVARVPLTVFTVIGTTLALGIGLGSQNIVNNFISGIIIMIERPIKIGDIIEIKNIAGKVTNIGARCTSIKTSKNINILVPNSSILQDVIVNWTLEDTMLKVSLELLLENKTDIAEIDQMILSVLSKNPHVLKSPEPQILLKGLCKNGYDLDVEFWIDLAEEGKSHYIINDINRDLLPLLKLKGVGVIDKPYLLPTHPAS